MNKHDEKFLHDLINKLAKIDGFTAMLKAELIDENSLLLKIEKANVEAIEIVKNYRDLLESIDDQND